MAWAHMEYFEGGVIRVFADQAAYNVDPYLYAIAFKVTEEDAQTIELLGAIKAPTPSQYRAIAHEMRARGLKIIRRRVTGANPGIKELT